MLPAALSLATLANNHVSLWLSFDLILVGGIGYFIITLNEHKNSITCSVPVFAWQYIFYANILACRVGLFIYSTAERLAKCAIYTTLFLLMPSLLANTILGTIFYKKMTNEEEGCYPDSAQPWTVIFDLCVGWFLVYIYLMLACTACYGYVSTEKD